MTAVAVAVPNLTTAPVVVKFVPVIVTELLPAVAPALGLTDVTVGSARSEKLNTSFALVADGPPGVVTTTSTSPATCAGVTAVIVVAFWTVKLAAEVPPKLTVG